jgi:hypothetical protein
MRSRTTPGFWELFKALPESIRTEAKASYKRFKVDPYDPSLQFKEIKLRKNKSIWSVRVGRGYRALGVKPNDEEVVWGWIGSHADYDRLIESKRRERGGSPE